MPLLPRPLSTDEPPTLKRLRRLMLACWLLAALCLLGGVIVRADELMRVGVATAFAAIALSLWWLYHYVARRMTVFLELGHSEPPKHRDDDADSNVLPMPSDELR